MFEMLFLAISAKIEFFDSCADCEFEFPEMAHTLTKFLEETLNFCTVFKFLVVEVAGPEVRTLVTGPA
jgi:hypothetical protein